MVLYNFRNYGECGPWYYINAALHDCGAYTWRNYSWSAQKQGYLYRRAWFV